ncbi:Uncharacterized protein HZ326_8014 [Fusarium oxysporum f. sp. albedinis]|nr:Uncharacterized protein HZ326_8014 [Fusarium oxysporum f. sp. albedinis]
MFTTRHQASQPPHDGLSWLALVHQVWTDSLLLQDSPKRFPNSYDSLTTYPGRCPSKFLSCQGHIIIC